MKIEEQITRLRRAVNGSKDTQPSTAEARLHAALETGLKKYDDEACQEFAAQERQYNAGEVADGLQMDATELRLLLRRIVDDWDTLPLSEAEFNFFGRITDALTAYEYEMRSGHPASERICTLCGAPVSQCCC